MSSEVGISYSLDLQLTIAWDRPQFDLDLIERELVRGLRLVPPGEGIHLVLDRTDLSIVGAGEWAAAKHGGRSRRGWRKLHLGVNPSGVILVHTLTEATG